MTSMPAPAVPVGAYDDFVLGAAPASRAQRRWQAVDGVMPSLYLGHGAPPLLDDAEWMQGLFSWSQSMPKPQGILVVSAHWESAPLALSAPAAGTPLLYDFRGFARRYYEVAYPTPEAGALARRVASAMPDTDPVHQHARRGLDHGAWVPLMVMYPLGDVPVLQLSLPTSDPDRLLELGRRLRPLREEGVLMIGSGFLTHGLPFLTRDAFLGRTVPGWSADFDAWAADALDRGDVDELAAFRSKAPGMPYAHPTVEHYIPLFVSLGAALSADGPVHTVLDGFKMGLARRSLQLA